MIAKMIVDGYLAGRHHSQRVGPGMEFSQYRSYQPGDDLRLLDWKMLARSGRYYIKQSEVETHISIKFIIDCSESMNHRLGDLTKMDYVRVLIASLTYLAQQQGDAVGIYALNEHELTQIQPQVNKHHFNRLLSTLVDLEPQGKWPATNHRQQPVHDRTHKELLFFISDFYQHDQELTRFIEQLKTTRNEVVAFQIMSHEELEFGYQGQITLEDLETGEQLQVDAAVAKKPYLDALQNHMTQVKNQLLDAGIFYHLFNLDEPMGSALSVFLKQRSKLI